MANSNIYQGANVQFLEALSKQLAEGKLNAEEASKLLNTVARFEERTHETELNHL